MDDVKVIHVKWTSKEELFLLDNHLKITIKEIGNILNRNEGAVSAKLQSLKGYFKKYIENKDEEYHKEIREYKKQYYKKNKEYFKDYYKRKKLKTEKVI